MKSDIQNFLHGYVTIRITGNAYDRFLNLCAYHEILLWDLKPEQETYLASVSIRDFKKLKAIVRKSRTSVRIAHRHGLPFFIHKYQKRRGYLLGIAAAALVMFWLSAHIWNISIDGNLSQTDDIIFEYLETNGIWPGMVKSQVDCKMLAAEIRNYFSDFTWVAVKLQGTRLLIQVKEGILQEEDTEEKDAPSSLYAGSDGIVTKLLVRTGRPLVSQGTEVKKGDLLVSGYLPIYGDEGTQISSQLTSADADVLIRKTIHYQDRLSLKGLQKQYTGHEKTRWGIRILDRSFSLWSLFPSYDTYDIFSEVTQLRLGRNFYLPVYLQKFTVKEYEKTDIVYTKEEAYQILSSNFLYFTKKLEEKGVQIFQNDVKIKWSAQTVQASGTLLVDDPAVRRGAIETEEETANNEYG